MELILCIACVQSTSAECEAEKLKTDVLSVRIRKSLKDEAEKLGVDLRKAVEERLEELVAEKKARAQQVAKKLSELMDVTPQEWVNNVKTTRKKCEVA